MIKRTSAELTAALAREGLAFKRFQLVHEGDYAVDDADWNYKDVPHLTHIHKLVDAYPSHMADKSIASINVQKVLGLRIPLTLFNYESGPNRQTYHTCFGPLVMIIETSYQALAPLRTRVTTEYAIGAHPWLLPLAFPLVRWSLTRNYRDLMSGDIPMRERRGRIRQWGYRILKREETYSFPATMRIHEPNILPPSGEARSWGTREFAWGEFSPERCVRAGEPDHYGLQLRWREGRIEVFPRMCPHEGAALDDHDAPGSGQPGPQVVCPWHARRFKALAVFTPGVAGARATTAFHVLESTAFGLRVTCRPTPLESPSIEP